MPAQLSFPSTLGRERHKSIIAFTCIQPKDKLASLAASFGTKPVFGHTDGGTVFLYMPDLGERAYGQNFNSDEMGMMEKIITAFMGDGDIGDKFSKAGTMIGSTIGGDARDKLSTDIANPHTTTRYEGPVLRTQSFTFELFPRDEGELTAIRDIVRFFKLNSSTRVGGNQQEVDVVNAARSGNLINNVSNGSMLVGDRLKYPDQWLIQELSPDPKKGRIMPLFKFGPAYCTSVKITDAHNRPTFITGDTISYTLTLDFTEATMLTSADIEAGA